MHTTRLFLVCLLTCLLRSWPVQWFVTFLGIDAFTAVTRTRYTESKALQAFFTSMPLPAQRSTDLRSSWRSGSSNPFFHGPISCYPRGRCSRYCCYALILTFHGPCWPSLFSQHYCNSAPICSKLVSASSTLKILSNPGPQDLLPSQP